MLAVTNRLRRPAGAPATPAQANAGDGRVAAGLGLLLFSLYSLTFGGHFRSIDELALFAVTENLVLAGDPAPLLVAFARFHNPVGAFEPGFPLLAAPLYWLASHWHTVSNVHAVMLLNPLLTAATGSLLYVFARRLGYSGSGGVALGLAWGLGSMAWPYTKSFLREPAVALLWTVAFLGAARFVERPTWRLAALALAPAAAAVGVKVACVVAWPVLLGMLAWAWHRSRRLSRAWLVVLAAGGAGLAVAAGMAFLTLRGYDALGVVRQVFQAPLTRDSLIVYYGLLFSPGKSVFLYSPVLLLAVAGWPAFYRRHAALALALAGLWLLMLVSLRASVWTGGLTWGPRFLLPLLPVSMLPALAWLPGRWWAVALAGLSAVFQAIVSTANWARFYQYLAGRYPGQDPDLTVGLDWGRFVESPTVLALRLWGRDNLDMAWLYTGLAGEVKLDPALALMLALLVTVAAVGLWAAWHQRHAARTLRLGLLAAGGLAVGLLWRAYWGLPDYPALASVTMRHLASQVAAGSPALMINVSPDIGTYHWLGLVKGPQRRVWVSPAQTEGFETLLPGSGRVDLVIDRPHIASLYPGDVLAAWLNERAYRLGSVWIDGYEVVTYEAGPNPGVRAEAAYAWSNGLALRSYTVPASVRSGGVVPLDFVFERVSGNGAAHHRFFANLIGPDGQLAAGHEGELQFGHLAAAGWPADGQATDKRGLQLPSDAASGQYTLVVGFANGAGYVPAQGPGGQTADYVELVAVEVLP